MTLTKNGKSPADKKSSAGQMFRFETRFAQPFGFVGQQQKLLGNERKARVIKREGSPR